VSAKSKADTADEQQKTLNAAKACKAERANDPEAFKHWGTNANKANAFGKCVSATAKEQGDLDDD
jgi:hypothetical protein